MKLSGNQKHLLAENSVVNLIGILVCLIWCILTVHLKLFQRRRKEKKRNRHEESPTTKPAVRPIQTNGPCGAAGASMLSTHRVGNLHIILIANGDTMAFFFYPKVYAILEYFFTSEQQNKSLIYLELS